MRETQRRVVTRVRHRHHDVRVDRISSRELASHLSAHLRHIHAAHDAVRSREINVLEHAKRFFFLAERPLRANAFVANDEHFARPDLANVFGMDEIERAGFRRKNVSVVELAEHERPETERIAHADDLALAHDNKTERTFEPAKNAQWAAAVLRWLSEKMRNNLAVRGSLENGAFAFQFVAKYRGVDQVTIVRHGDLAAKAIYHEGLRVFQGARSGGGITSMAQRARPFQPLQLFRAEDLRDEPHVAMQLEGRSGAVARDDAGAFLPAMLEREEAVIREHSGVGMAEDRENPAFVLGKRQCGVLGIQGWLVGHRTDSIR